MFKFVVLSALLAAAVAKPGALIATPLTYSTIVSPGATTITQQASSVVHPSPPVVYSTPLTYAHYIKKRSVALGTYIPSTYYSHTPVVSAPLANTYSAPLYHGAHILPAGASLPLIGTHFIKKRSAPLFPTAFITPTTYAAHTPILTSTYAAPTPIISPTPLISHPIAYAPHYIKKRSAPFFSTYAALPTSYSHQSRVDVTHSSPLITSYSAPITYTSPLGFSHIL